MKKEVTDEWEVQDDIRRENVFQGMLTQFDEDADSALAVLRSNVKKGTVEEVRGQDLFETDYDGGSLEACIEARLNSFIFRKDRDDFRNLFMMDNLVERYYDGLGPVSMVGYCKRASGRQCFVRFTGSVLVNPLTGDVMSFGLEKECNMEMVAQALNEKVLAQQYDMVSYIVGDHYGVVIGNSSSIKVGSIFPRKREGLYDEYINSQVMPVAVGMPEELEKLREALSVERIANELADSDSYTVDLTCEIDGAHYNKRFSYHSVDQDANFYIVLKTDMTEVIHAERERNEILAQTLKEAERANQAKTVFLSNMSHEIRTPMNAIIGLNTLALKDENLSSETRGYLEKIGESARHLLSLINDILDMSRIESGRMSLRIEEFSFGGMLDQINTMVQSQCSDKGLTFECQVIGDLGKNYMGDSTKLKQILLNILGNAIKFTDAPGAVTLRVEKTASFDNRSTFRFSIKDTGIGISEEFLPNIFEPFTQEDSSRSNRYGSTGLGMAITRNIVEMMNGTINVSSQKGAGTEFVVSVTLIDGEEDSHSAGIVHLHDMKILIVDDDPVACSHAKMVLEEAGIMADVAMSGKEALLRVERHNAKHEPYNLILLDWKMPEIDGVQVAKEIRSRYKDDMVIIILTAYNLDDVLDDAIKAGVDSVLVKPLFSADIIEEFGRIARRKNITFLKNGRRVRLDGKKILMAEDIWINAEIMRQLLGAKGAEIEHAVDGSETVRMFSESPAGYYSAILMDIRMPVMDGLEATEAIRKLDRADASVVPIIAMTANAFDEDEQLSLQVGMNAHLSKPVNQEQLYQTLETLIYEREEKERAAQKDS